MPGTLQRSLSPDSHDWSPIPRLPSTLSAEGITERTTDLLASLLTNPGQPTLSDLAKLSAALDSRVTCVIYNAHHAMLMRTMCTAVKGPVRFDSVPDNLAPTVFADGSEFMDGALKAIESVRLTGSNDLER